jgi:phage/plasmid-like protein (TIGR03299 family)
MTASASANRVTSAYTAPGARGVAVYGRYRDHGYRAQPLTSQVGSMVAPGVGNAEAFRQAGLAWKADKRPAFFMGPDGPLSSAEHCSIVRSDNDALLGIHGKGYTPVQNTALIEVLDFLREDADLESVLSIRDGRKVFASARMRCSAEVLPGDEVRRYLHIFNSHDGSSSFGIFFSDVRLFCANQLNFLTGAAMGGATAAGTGLRRKHTSSVTDFVEGLPGRIDAQRRAFGDEIETLRAFTKIPLTVGKTRQILEATFADKLAKPITPKGETEARPRTINDLPELDTIIGHYRGSTGLGIADLPGAAGTVYGLFNAITQFYTHDAGRAKDAIERSRSRLESLWGGDSAKRIERTRQACLALI